MKTENADAISHFALFEYPLIIHHIFRRNPESGGCCLIFIRRHPQFRLIIVQSHYLAACLDGSSIYLF